MLNSLGAAFNLGRKTLLVTGLNGYSAIDH
jgi:hypothetical protein